MSVYSKTLEDISNLLLFNTAFADIYEDVNPVGEKFMTTSTITVWIMIASG